MYWWMIISMFNAFTCNHPVTQLAQNTAAYLTKNAYYLPLFASVDWDWCVGILVTLTARVSKSFTRHTFDHTCNTVFSCGLQAMSKTSNALNGLKRRATKHVYSLRQLRYELRLLKKLGSTILKTRRLRGDLVETYTRFWPRKNVLILVTSSSLQILVTTFEDTVWSCTSLMSYKHSETLLQSTHHRHLERSSSTCCGCTIHQFVHHHTSTSQQTSIVLPG